MAIRLPTASRNAAADAVVDRTDSGGAGSIEIRTGSQPASANDAATGTLLVAIPLAATAFGSASNGTASLAGVPLSGTAVADGTAGWFRMLNGSGQTVLDGSVSTPGGGGDLQLATTTITTGLTVTITTGTVTMPAG